MIKKGIGNNKFKSTIDIIGKPSNNEFIDDKDMFLYKKGKTIGLRKDKKIHKFMGLRSGKSKQFELSLKSVLVDNNEIISKNRVNFNNITLDGESVVHELSGTKFYNQVSDTRYRHLVKMESNFTNIEIKYEVHLKGLKVTNRLINGVYAPDANNEFIIGDRWSEKTNCIINEPLVFDEEGNKYSIVNHTLYLEDDVLYYMKTIRGNSLKELPLYVDASINYNQQSTFRIRRRNNPFTVEVESDSWNNLHNNISCTDTKDDDDSSYINLGMKDTFNSEDNTTYKEGTIERSFISFDISDVNKEKVYRGILKGNIAALPDNPINTSMIILKGAQDPTNINNTNWGDYIDTEYSDIRIGEGVFEIILNDDFMTDLINDDVINICLMNYENDYLQVPPLSSDLSPYTWLFNNLTSIQLEVYTREEIGERVTLELPIEVDKSGTLSSSADNYNDAKAGNGIMNESFGEGIYENAIGFKYEIIESDEDGVDDIFNYKLNRTFLSYDTTSVSDYIGVVSSCKLVTLPYIEESENISVLQSFQGNELKSTPETFSTLGTHYGDITDIISNNYTSLNIPLDNMDINGSTQFVLMSKKHDFENDDNNGEVISTYTGLDFNKTYLEVIIDPYYVYGRSVLRIVFGEYANMSAYTNAGNREDIEWYADSGYTELIDNGGDITLYSMDYKNGDIIYGVIEYEEGKYSVPLELIINVYVPNYIYIEERTPNYYYVDLDNIYFKYHKCLSGICYTYSRDLKNIYESNRLVSDNDINASYNMYNEFDIIDEFFSNSHEVHVAVGENIDITLKYPELDGVYMNQGTKVLLYAQENPEEVGIYTIQYNNTLVKDEGLDTIEGIFRYKVHVGAGTHLDDEFHVNGYVQI